jgi:hypothetical protein
MVMRGPQQHLLIAICRGDSLCGEARARRALPGPVQRLRHDARQLRSAVEMRDSRLTSDEVGPSRALSPLNE